MQVMNAGLFPAVRASGLFSVDPDIGIGGLCNTQEIQVLANKLRN